MTISQFSAACEKDSKNAVACIRDLISIITNCSRLRLDDQLLIF